MPSQKVPQGGGTLPQARCTVSNSLTPAESGAPEEFQATLRRAKEVTQKPVQPSSSASGRSSCEGGQVGESSGSIGEVDAERESEQSVRGGALARLEANVAASVFLPSAVPVAAMEAELLRVRAELANVRTTAPPFSNRFREDFVPNIVEEAELWMRCRQQDMEDAIAPGPKGMFPGWRT